MCRYQYYIIRLRLKQLVELNSKDSSNQNNFNKNGVQDAKNCYNCNDFPSVRANEMYLTFYNNP